MYYHQPIHLPSSLEYVSHVLCVYEQHHSNCYQEVFVFQGEYGIHPAPSSITHVKECVPEHAIFLKESHMSNKQFP